MMTEKCGYDKIISMKNMQTYLKFCFLCLLIVSCFLLSLGQLEDQDAWLWLKAGEWMVTNMKVPNNQLFSYSIEGVPCGFGQLDIMDYIKRVFKKGKRSIFLLTSWLVSGLFLERVPVRPELISALFMTLYLYVLFNKKNIWWLVFIQAIWVNMYGYSIFGPILLALFILSEFVKHKILLPFD